MKVTERTAQTVATHSVELTLEADASEHLTASYRQGLFAPDRLHISWRRVDDGDWALERCKTSGFMVKKDGTAGVQRSDRSFKGYGGQSLIDSTPDWVAPLVEANHP